MTAVQRRLAAIMFSDIVGYSRLMGDDEAGTLTLLREHNALLVPIVKAHGGSVLKFIGDAILSSFESASPGVLCAVAIQKALAARNKATIAHARGFLNKAATDCPASNPRRAYALRELERLSSHSQ